jgi:hypothetical protein
VQVVYLTTSNNIIVGNDTFSKYDFSSVFTEADKKQAMSVIKNIIDSGNYFENSPKYQTKENIFNRHEQCFLKLRMSFIFSCFMYLRTEVPIKNMMAWSFMTSNDTTEDRNDLWHTHHLTKQNKSISGIFYLHIPEDVDSFETSGTEFAPNGMSDPERLLVHPSPYSWVIYPSNIYHRPTAPQSSQFRFVVAADLEF